MSQRHIWPCYLRHRGLDAFIDVPARWVECFSTPNVTNRDLESDREVEHFVEPHTNVATPTLSHLSHHTNTSDRGALDSTWRQQTMQKATERKQSSMLLTRGSKKTHLSMALHWNLAFQGRRCTVTSIKTINAKHSYGGCAFAIGW